MSNEGTRDVSGQRTVTRRQLLKEASAGAAALLLAGCGSTQYDSQSAATQAPAAAGTTAPVVGDRTLIRFHHRSEYGEYHQQQAAAFNKMQGRYQVQVELTPLADLEQKLTTLVAGGQLGDAYSATPFSYFYPFADRGISGDLRPLAEADKYDMDVFFPAVIEQLTWEERLAGWPQGTHAGWTSLYTNMDLWSKSGADVPEWEWTYEDQWLSAVRSVVDSTAQGKAKTFAFLFDFIPQAMYTFVRSWGGDWIDPEDGKTATLTSEQSTAALKFMHDLVYQHKVSPTPEAVVEEMWSNSLVASWKFGSWYASTAESTVKDKFEWKVFPAPAGPGGRSSFLGADSICMNAKSKNPEGVFEWFKFLTTKENGLAAWATGMPVPARRDAWEDPRIAENPNLQPAAQWMEVVKPVTVPANARVNELSPAVTQGLEAFFREETFSQSAVQRLNDAIQGVLDKQ